MPKDTLTDIDRRILRRLQEDGRLSNVELAYQVGLSQSPCLRRVRALEERGVIQRYAALVDQRTVDLPVSVLVHVSLKLQGRDALTEFESAVRKRPEVMECYLMTGEADYLLRVVAANLAAYERFLLDHLTGIAVVASIKSSFALKQVVYKTALPVQQCHPARRSGPARASSAPVRSAMMSAGDSRPTDRRIRPSAIPCSQRSSGV